ncbi:MAG: hypothetical protein Q9162_000680 [Coniocarpon cinnabarinum]
MPRPIRFNTAGLKQRATKVVLKNTPHGRVLDFFCGKRIEKVLRNPPLDLIEEYCKGLNPPIEIPKGLSLCARVDEREDNRELKVLFDDQPDLAINLARFLAHTITPDLLNKNQRLWLRKKVYTAKANHGKKLKLAVAPVEKTQRKEGHRAGLWQIRDLTSNHAADESWMTSMLPWSSTATDLKGWFDIWQKLEKFRQHREPAIRAGVKEFKRKKGLPADDADDSPSILHFGGWLKHNLVGMLVSGAKESCYDQIVIMIVHKEIKDGKVQLIKYELHFGLAALHPHPIEVPVKSLKKDPQTKPKTQTQFVTQLRDYKPGTGAVFKDSRIRPQSRRGSTTSENTEDDSTSNE